MLKNICYCFSHREAYINSIKYVAMTDRKHVIKLDLLLVHLNVYDPNFVNEQPRSSKYDF